MSLGPRLILRQSQSLVMTPQLQQAIKLLALPNQELESFLAEAMAANPLLELDDSAAATAQPEVAQDRRTRLESSGVDRLIGEGRGEEDQPLDIDKGVLDRDDDTGDSSAAALELGAAYDRGGTGDGPAGLALEGHPLSLSEHLHAQVGAASADSRLVAVARGLIDQLDEAGYLPLPLDQAVDGLGVSPAAAEAALGLVQSLDPTGVGARSLAECLALQAREADRLDPCMARLLDNLALLASGSLAQLKRLCGVDDEDFAGMLAELRSYDPKPGLRFGGEPVESVQPDILVRPAPGGGWDIALNPATLPRLVVNRSYYLELRADCGDKDARGWLAEKLADASWLVRALDQRQRTILKVAAEIVRHQDGFFRRGVSELRPLTLRAVAEAASLHESTVSRVTSGKYLQCDRGTFELKYFFTSGVASASAGGEAVSASAVKAAIRSLIDEERADAVLSDDALVELLRGRGFELARRTVAKYREALGIGSSVQRRRHKALKAIHKNESIRPVSGTVERNRTSWR